MSNYHIGTGIFNVSDPAIGTNLQGFAVDRQKTTGVESNLYSRAFAVWDQDTDRRVVIAVADIWSCTQAIKAEVIARLNSFASGIYTNENVLISGTHTHSAPGGYSHYYLYNHSIGGFDSHTFECIVSGIVLSIQQAHDNLSPGKIFINSGTVDNCGEQRSSLAYNTNPLAQRQKYASDTDKTMLLLKFVKIDGTLEIPIGMLNWYAIHPTDRGQKNTDVTGDNKGYASELFETEMNAASLVQRPLVAAFANANCGDVSGNVELGHIPDGIHDATQMRKHGERQFHKAKELFDTAIEELEGSVDFRHQFVDMEQATGLPGTLGLSMFAGSTEDGVPEPPSGLEEGIVEGNVSIGQRAIQAAIGGGFQIAAFGIATPTALALNSQEVSGHLPKPITLAPGRATLLAGQPYPITPNVLPLQVLKIGALLVAGVPAELTTMAGRVLREAILEEVASSDIKHCALATYANGYSQYVTTQSEYNAQHYEGASTLFGPDTLAAYVDTFNDLAKAINEETTVPTGTAPIVSPIFRTRRVTLRNLSGSDVELEFFKQSGDLLGGPTGFLGTFAVPFTTKQVKARSEYLFLLPPDVDEAKVRVEGSHVVENLKIGDILIISPNGQAARSDYVLPDRTAQKLQMADLNVVADSMHAVTAVKKGNQFEPGTYQNVTLTAKNGHSIHVYGPLVVIDTLIIIAESAATILLPQKVSCETLIVKGTLASNISANDLEVDDLATVTVDKAATASLHMVLNSGEIAGRVVYHSIFNSWVDWPNGLTSDTVQVDHTSSYSRKGWAGPS